MSMSTHVPRLTRLFTPAYAQLINAQLVHPAPSVLVKPNELLSSLARPVHVAWYAGADEQEKTDAVYLAATLGYGIVKGHPFMDGNKRTAFFLANEYMRAMGLPGLGVGLAGNDAGNNIGKGEGKGNAGEPAVPVHIAMAELQMGVAAGTLDLDELAEGMKKVLATGKW